MKRLPLILALFLGLLFVRCKKEIDGTESTFLFVEKKNSSLLFHYSSTTLDESGSNGFALFESNLAAFDSTEVLGTITLGSVGGANNDTIYRSLEAKYGVSTLPYLQSNLLEKELPEAMATHNYSTVIANASYELDLTTSGKIVVNTTTEFFESVVGEDYYLSAYIIVDSLVAPQAGHPDGNSAVHRKVVVDVARPNGGVPRYHGYKVATGNIDKGYRFNLSLEADRLPAWSDPRHISVALVITKRSTPNGIPIFVNANTNH